MQKRSISAVLVSVAFLLTSTAQAAIVNGDFEAGSLTGWTLLSAKTQIGERQYLGSSRRRLIRIPPYLRRVLWTTRQPRSSTPRRVSGRPLEHYMREPDTLRFRSYCRKGAGHQRVRARDRAGDRSAGGGRCCLHRAHPHPSSAAVGCGAEPLCAERRLDRPGLRLHRLLLARLLRGFGTLTRHSCRLRLLARSYIGSVDVRAGAR